MVAANLVETSSPITSKACHSCGPRESLHVRAMALPFASVYGRGVRSVQIARVKRPVRTAICRFYSDDRSFGRTFTVASAARASVSTGSRTLPLNALPYAPSSSASSATTIRGSREATKPPRHIRSISSGCLVGRDRRSFPGRRSLQALQGGPAISPTSS
jgi:hypothetical protein